MSVQDALNSAYASLSAGRPQAALARLDAALREVPGNTDLLRLKAAAAWQIGDLYVADDCLRTMQASGEISATEIDVMTARLALDLLEFERARAAVDRLVERGEIDAVAQTAVRLLTWQGEQAEALDILYRGLRSQPENPDLIALAVTHDPGLTGELLTKAEALLISLPANTAARTGLLYPLARYFDRRGDYARAWALMVQANQEAAARHGWAYDEPGRIALKASLKNRAARAIELSAASPELAEISGTQFVYLVGAPRTGSSLLQSILSAHRNVQSAGERGALLPHLNRASDASDHSPEADFLSRLQAADHAGLARAKLTAPTLIDKTTHNFFVAPLIKAIHPHARFINVLRRPQDVMLSILFHEFPAVFEESCDPGAIIAALEARADIAGMYEAEGMSMSTVSFDAFTAAPNTKGETLAKLAGLTWQPETLDPSARNAAVPTFSAGQVRKPIKPTPADKWRRFAPFMPTEHVEALAQLAARQE